MTKQVTSCGAGPCTLTDDESEWGWSVHDDQRIGRRLKGEKDSGSILHNSTVALPTHQYSNMPMSAHSVHNPSRRRIRGMDRDTFRDRFNTRRWPISRDHRKSSYNLVILE